MAGRWSISRTAPDVERVTVPVAPSVRQPVPTAVETERAPEKSRIATPSSVTTSPANWYDGRKALASRPADAPPTMTTPSGSARAMASSVACGIGAVRLGQHDADLRLAVRGGEGLGRGVPAGRVAVAAETRPQTRGHIHHVRGEHRQRDRVLLVATGRRDLGGGCRTHDRHVGKRLAERRRHGRIEAVERGEEDPRLGPKVTERGLAFRDGGGDRIQRRRLRRSARPPS